MAIVGAFAVPHPPILLPEIGRGEEQKIDKTRKAYEEVARRIAALCPDTVVIVSPHSVMYADYFHISPGEGATGDFSQFGVSDLRIESKYDMEFVQKLTDLAGASGLAAGTFGERDSHLDHGTMIPLYFLKKAGITCKIVRIGLSGLPVLTHYRLGECVAKASDALARRTVLIASGDLSHKLRKDGPYGFAPEGPLFDEQVTQAMAQANFLQWMQFSAGFCDAAAECGLRALLIMAGALDGRAVEAQLLSYEGPFGVGYGVAAFLPVGQDASRCFGPMYEKWREETVKQQMQASREAEDDYVKLARLSLETYVKKGRSAARPENLPEDLIKGRAGVFVSLKKDGRLRGCIGTIGPVTDSIADEIMHNAISAGAEDPRFDPVTEAELPELVYSVDVLGEPERIAGMGELDVKRYGVIVTTEERRGLLLPNLEGVDTPRQQVAIALQKAGISPEEDYRMERFEVVRHK